MVRFDHPVLPAFLNEVRLRRLEIGAASVDVVLRRAGDEVAVNVTARRGDIRVITTS